MTGPEAAGAPPVRPLPGPAHEVEEAVTSPQRSTEAFHGVAQRAEQHLERLLAALPSGVAVVRGRHVLVSNHVATAHLPGPDEGTFSLPDAASMAAQSHIIVPDARGRPTSVSTRPIVWDNYDCVLVTLEPVPSPPAAPDADAPDAAAAAGGSPTDTATDDAQPEAPAVEAPPRPASPAAGPRERWLPVIDLAGGRVAGFSSTPGDGVDEAELHRWMVRAIGALAEWGDGRSPLETPVTTVRVPAGHPVDAALVAFVGAVVRRAHAHASRLWVRVKRDALDGPGAIDHLAALRRAGPRVMVEGLAHSDRLTEAAALPVDGVTVPRGMLETGDWSMIHSALSIARHHGLATLATGVPDIQTHERVAGRGVPLGRGRGVRPHPRPRRRLAGVRIPGPGAYRLGRARRGRDQTERRC